MTSDHLPEDDLGFVARWNRKHNPWSLWYDPSRRPPSPVPHHECQPWKPAKPPTDADLDCIYRDTRPTSLATPEISEWTEVLISEVRRHRALAKSNPVTVITHQHDWVDEGDGLSWCSSCGQIYFFTDHNSREFGIPVTIDPDQPKGVVTLRSGDSSVDIGVSAPELPTIEFLREILPSSDRNNK